MAAYHPVPTGSADRDLRVRDGLRHRLLSYLPLSRARLLFLLLSTSALFSLFLLVHFYPLNYSFSDTLPEPAFYQGGEDIWAHNDAVSQRLDHCASLGLLRNTSSPSIHSIYPEETYTAAGCGLNSTTLVILSSLYFVEAYSGATFGESIWATSIMSALSRLGYSYMFSSLGWWNHDMAKTMEIYNKYPGQVRLVVADPEQVVVAFGEQRARCIRSQNNPGGMEEWKFLGFNFWDTNDPKYGPAYTLPDHPLGPHFTLSPAPSTQTTHFSLPYSVELTCRHHTRHTANPRAYLMAKRTSYLSSSAPSFPWTIPDLGRIGTQLNIEIVVGLGEDDDAATGELAREHGIVDLGKLGKEDFMEELGKSSVVIGAGRPFISPSPWDALCMGTPFINPILAWDENDPDNRTSWKMQHGHMTDLNPPYVYSVHAHDHSALRKAIQASLDNPIKSFIPDFMTLEAVKRRVGEMIEWDWEGEWRNLSKETEVEGA